MQDNYNLVDCATMGIADYLKNTKYIKPKWMNKTEGAAHKIGFERCKEQCRLDRTTKR